jgi:hypothetical protein
VTDRYARLGLAIEPEHVPPLLDRIRAHVTATKCEPSPADLTHFYLATRPATAARRTPWTA